MLNNLEKGDIVAIRKANGQTTQVTVLSVKQDYEKPGAFVRFDYIDYNESSPMRRTAYPNELLQILRKSNIPKLDPKAPRPGDESKPGQKTIVVDGKVYVERGTAQHSESVPVNAQANTQVHEAVKAPPKPVTERIKKAKTEAAVK